MEQNYTDEMIDKLKELLQKRDKEILSERIKLGIRLSKQKKSQK